MGKNALNTLLPYSECSIIITTKHAKSLAIASPFWNRLRASVLEYTLDTDLLGTFSGEIERQGNALECVRRKCKMGMDRLGEKAEYFLANEGSFGPHPKMPFLPCDQEILYFIDCKRNFHLYLTHVTEKTNYKMESLDSLVKLEKFVEATQFPSHALIVRPNDRKDARFLFKGIDTYQALEEAFNASVKYSTDGKVWVETDMRAHMNPSRMKVIQELADRMAQRLSTLCSACNAPGWGMIRVEKGLHCEYCDQKTEMIAHEIYGCVLCDYTKKKLRSDGLISAPQMYCDWCNP